MSTMKRTGVILLIATMLLMAFPLSVSSSSGEVPIAGTSDGESSIDYSVASGGGQSSVQNSVDGNLRHFTHSVYNLPWSLDPTSVFLQSDYGVMQNYYETLVWYDNGDPNTLIPWLATQVPSVDNGLISPDGLHYVYPIRQSVLFHDGTLMDAYDVEYSIERFLIRNDPNGISYLLGEALLGYAPDYGTPLDPSLIDTTVNVLDQWTVQVNLAERFPGFNALMATQAMSIISKDYIIANEPDVFGTQNYWMSTHEMGTGPYTISATEPYSYMTLARFDYYWRGQAAIPSVDLIVNWWSPIQFEEGAVDITGLPYNELPNFISYPDVNVYWGEPTFTSYHIGMNQDIQPGLNFGDVPSDFFADENVRNAFIFSMDRDVFISSYFGVDMPRPNGPIPLGMWGCPNWPPQGFNLSLAGFLLSQAINPATGNSWAEDGFHIVFYYEYDNFYRETQFNIWKAGLESLTDLGYVSGEIAVDVIGLDWPVFLDARSSGMLAVSSRGWSCDYVDPDNFVRAYVRSGGQIASEYHISDSSLDAMIDAAAQELDKSVRTGLYENIVIASYQKGLYLWTYQEMSSTITQAWVHGFHINPALNGQDCNAYYYDLTWDPQLPGAPESLTATTAADHIDLSWETPSSSGSRPVETYYIYRGQGGAPSLLDSVSAQSGSPFLYRDYSVLPGVEYTYYVSALNQLGESAWAGPAHATFVVQMNIDIGPYQYPNVIVLGSRTIIKVAVFGSQDLPVPNINRKSVKFAGAAPLTWSFSDIDRDGITDIVFSFKASSLDLNRWSTSATLTLMTFDGRSWTAMDSVKVVTRASNWLL